MGEVPGMKRGLFEREERRLEQLTERDSDRTRYPFGWREDFCPGTLGCQEALHLAQVFGALVERELAEHPAVLMNRDWFVLAGRACDALHELHRAIGLAHPEPPANTLALKLGRK